VPGLVETFHAITVDRQFPHPLIKALVMRDEAELLAMDGAGAARRDKPPSARPHG